MAVIGTSWATGSWVGGANWAEGSWATGAWVSGEVWEAGCWTGWKRYAWGTMGWGEGGWQLGSWVDAAIPPRPGAGREVGPRLDDDPWFYARRDDEEFIGLLMAIAPIIFD